ncbi:TIGR04150 pseudo-rSAM protein [Perlabentimonas gracilis]|uniref:TIGR04150 pseudo-rSAM protein n=1 Tax=Perlabentimonas gracilis TaxID=2715279 RepID=UPI001408B49E|nr:TIGR04150 pseudo-rSAM protein [Perlabentimonas gracilis]NHB70280.1 TIGR04150 pseudo-rSAM protein [Perlabentimonas gracilis]
MTKYMLYLEPYTFLKRDEEKVLIVNTLSGKCFVVNAFVELNQLVDRIQTNEKSYSVQLDASEIENSQYSEFISIVRSTYSGDVVKLEGQSLPPVILPPRVNNRLDIAKLSNNKDRSIGDEAKDYIQEVTVVLTNKCSFDCTDCSKHYRQFAACTKAFGDLMELSLGQVKKFFKQFNPQRHPAVAIIGGDITQYSELTDALLYFASINAKKSLLLHANHIQRFVNSVGNNMPSSISLKVNIPPDCTEPFFLEFVPRLIAQYEVMLQFIVESEKDFLKANALANKLELENVSFKPFFNGHNFEFFTNQVFLSHDDIICERYSKNDIFLRQSINSYDFGKITIIPNGEIVANPNFGSIGDVSTSIGDLYANEVENGKSWFRTRTEQPCNNCVYQWLCPSPSNYELAIGKPNLCHIFE